MADVSLHEVLSNNRDARYMRKLAERTDAREFARTVQKRADKTAELDRQAQNTIDADTAARQRAEAARTETRDVLQARSEASQRLADSYDQTSQANARAAAAEARRLDAEQFIRDQQLEEQLQDIQQERLDTIAAAREEGEAVPRGHFLDLVA